MNLPIILEINNPRQPQTGSEGPDHPDPKPDLLQTADSALTFVLGWGALAALRLGRSSRFAPLLVLVWAFVQTVLVEILCCWVGGLYFPPAETILLKQTLI